MRYQSVVALAATALTLTACADTAADTEARKAGLPAPTLHVLMADSQPPDSPTGQAMAAFVAEVTQLSGGSILIETVSAGEYADNAGDTKVVAALTQGDIQLATVPARAWSDAGAETMDVLQAPFEIVSAEHMQAVAEDTDLTSTALAGLEEVGAHGLAVFPERLRQLLGFGTPILTPSDVRGETIRVLNPGIGEYVEALGASPVQPTDTEYAAMRSAHSVRGAETDWTRALGLAAGAAITSDLVLYAKFDTIAANDEWWRSLTDDERNLLTRAGTHVREAAADAGEDVEELAAGFCSAGGVVARAGEQAVADFKKSIAPVTDSLDPTQLARLRADRPDDETPPPAECAPVADGLDPGHVVADGGDLPDGVYRFRITPSFAAAWNASHGPGDVLFDGPMTPDAIENVVITWTLRGGHYVFELDLNDALPFSAEGVYQVQGDQMLLALHPEIGNTVNRLRWEENPDGSLSLTQVDDLKRDWYYGIDWTRIG